MVLTEYNIQVNSVYPRTLDSPMLKRFVKENAEDPKKALAVFNNIHRRGELASVEEVSNIFVCMASDKSANITTTDIRCDWGYYIQVIQPK